MNVVKFKNHSFVGTPANGARILKVPAIKNRHKSGRKKLKPSEMITYKLTSKAETLAMERIVKNRNAKRENSKNIRNKEAEVQAAISNLQEAKALQDLLNNKIIEDSQILFNTFSLYELSDLTGLSTTTLRYKNKDVELPNRR